MRHSTGNYPERRQSLKDAVVYVSVWLMTFVAFTTFGLGVLFYFVFFHKGW